MKPLNLFLTSLLGLLVTATASPAQDKPPSQEKKLGLGIMLPYPSSMSSIISLPSFTGALSLRFRASDSIALTGLLGLNYITGSGATLAGISPSSSTTTTITGLSLGTLIDFTVAQMVATHTRLYLGIGGSINWLTASVPGSSSSVTISTIGILPVLGLEQRLFEHLSLNGGVFIPVGISTGSAATGSTSTSSGASLFSIGLSPFLGVYFYF